MKWKKEELELCLSLIKDGLTYKEISEKIKRSEDSVRSKLSKLGEVYTKYVDNKTICLNCNTEFKHIVSDERKFCSRSCSVSFNNKFRKKTRNKKPLTLDNVKYKKKKSKKCIVCNSDTSGRFCSNTCYSINKRNQINLSIDDGDTSFNCKFYKNYLIEKYGNRCMECDWSIKNPITGNVPIQLEHIDGDSSNNSLNNLKLLCPNCHSLTSTYGFLNNGKGRSERRKYRNYLKKLSVEELLEELKNTESDYQPVKKKIKQKSEKKTIEELISNYKSYQKVERPPLDILLKEVDELGYRGTGRKHSVSDVSIRKWIKMYMKHGENWLNT
jgi:hypothetical protein